MHLDALAGPGEILLSEPAHALLRDVVDVLPGEPTLLPGHAIPVAVFRLNARGALRRRAPRSTASLLVGRDEELRVLQHAWRRAQAGEPQALLVVGESGIGKSRLLDELRRDVADEAWIEWRCASETAGSPLRPVIDWLREFVGDTPLDCVVERWNLDRSSARPALSWLLAMAQRNEMEVPPQKRKSVTFEALLSLIVNRARTRPTVLSVEDLHWADPTTLELVTALLGDVRSALSLEDKTDIRLVLLLSSRPGTALPLRIAEMATLRLDRLSQSAVAQMIAARVPPAPKLPRDLVEQVIRRADGVPLFVEEMLRVVSGLGANLGAADAAVNVPGSLRDLSIARLDTLSAAARRIAQFAAVLGREFGEPLLSAVAARPSTELERALDELSAVGLIVRTPGNRGAAWAFRHVLLRDAAYECMVVSARQRAHEMVSRVLRDGFAETVQQRPELLALHLERAELTDDAVTYWRLAGERAMANWAEVEAAQHFARALELLPRLPYSPGRAERQLDLELSLGRTVASFEGYASGRTQAIFARAHGCCETLGNLPRLFSAINGLWAYHMLRGGRSADARIRRTAV